MIEYGGYPLEWKSIFVHLGDIKSNIRDMGTSGDGYTERDIITALEGQKDEAELSRHWFFEELRESGYETSNNTQFICICGNLVEY